ncbi:MAG: ABC transporter permease [Acidimicrobiia bacterium]
MTRTLSRATTLGTISVVAALALWEVAGRMDLSPALPSFSEVLVALGDLVLSDRFQQAALATAKTVAITYPVTVVVGVVLGVLMATVKPVRWALDPWVNLGLSLPLVSVIPVLIFVFGLDAATIVAVIVVYTLPVLIVNTASGVRSVDPEMVAMARSFGADRSMLLRRVILPGAAPLTVAGIRIGAGRAVRGAIVAEQLIGLIGLGGLIQRLGGAFAVADLYAAILFVGVLGVLIVSLLGRLENRVVV